MLWAMLITFPVYLCVKPPSGAQNQIIVIVRDLWVHWYGMPSLTTGLTCHLQLQPFSDMTIFYHLTFDTPPTWKASPPYLYPPGMGWPNYTLKQKVPFSLLPTTRRDKVELFEHASALTAAHYIASAWTPQKTNLPTFLLLCDISISTDFAETLLPIVTPLLCVT
jgi:hypothetical protein